MLRLLVQGEGVVRVVVVVVVVVVSFPLISGPGFVRKCPVIGIGILPGPGVVAGILLLTRA